MLFCGQTLAIVGGVGMLGAMLFGTTEEGINSVFFRGAFQRAVDYTPSGWRFWKASLRCALLGVVLVALVLLAVASND